MIALETTRERMLADIGASAAVLSTSSPDPTGAELVAAEQARLLVKRNAPEELLPSLNSFLERRFADIPPERLHRDVLSPLKKAVGNAHKRGNLRQNDKWITVEVVVTRTGAFLEISDEGNGFDVLATLARFRAGEEYFAHSGSGFRRYTKARSLVSFDRGGSTLRLRFLRG